ncbi:hypothetical protein SAMN04488570_1825 [Nocardioides scoriae]|uniref:Uncharacterized protein n=1 Tax=Nocardioides scoriae TaxID=642780 RepID=A0A1H1S0D2_9ACTN|nr:hypothetical protein SAMN04488570_1825 [Nocardioides scoriae]
MGWVGRHVHLVDPAPRCDAADVGLLTLPRAT